jgi:hypothetical protein
MDNPIDVPAIVPLQAFVKDLEVYDRINDPMQAVKTLGAAIFKSGLFGCDRMEQGEVLAMECLAQRKSPLELNRTYHFIEGRLAIRADALLAKYLVAGGQVEWMERSVEKVVARFYRGATSAIITHTLQEHVSNGNAVSSKTKELKDNWRKWPRQMLTARVISEGVRLIAPDCCFGSYVAEEIQDATPARQMADLARVIPEDLHPQAIALLIDMGKLTDGQTLADLEPSYAAMLAKKPDSFLAAARMQK